MNSNVSQALANAAMGNAMAQLNASGVHGWFPSIMAQLHSMFNVGESFVLRKIMVLFCPFIQKKDAGGQWGDSSPGPGMQQVQDGGKVGPDGLKEDINDAELYIPLMSLVTYGVVYGLQRLKENEFRPELLGSTFSFALTLLVLEVGCAKAGFYTAGNALPVIEILANCGYKYVHVVIMIALRIVLGNNPLYYVFFLYLAGSAAFALRRFLLPYGERYQGQYGGPLKLFNHIVLAVAVAQIPLCWLLTPA